MSTMLPAREPARPTYAKDKADIWREIQALWRLTRKKSAKSEEGCCERVTYQITGAPYTSHQGS